ncbi:MAG: hypothetical protein AAFP20_22545 [Cyanobacteria bacterium J06614_10]
MANAAFRDSEQFSIPNPLEGRTEKEQNNLRMMFVQRQLAVTICRLAPYVNVYLLLKRALQTKKGRFLEIWPITAHFSRQF